jgi:hypothetical protein
LADRYNKGVPPVPKDPGRAKALRGEALALATAYCQAGEVLGCQTAFSLATETKATAAERRIAAITQALCDQGYAGACLVGPGKRQQKEIRARANAAAEAAWTAHERSCRSGSDTACHALRRKLASSDAGLALNDPELFLQVIDVCAGTAEPACRLTYLDIRFAPPQTAGRALKRLQSACAAGQGQACIALASLDDSRPREDRFSAACKARDPDGCGLLGGILYERFRDGQGALAPASDAWARGCDLGHVPSCHYLKHLSRQ